jgi:hypothetical protein
MTATLRLRKPITSFTSHHRSKVTNPVTLFTHHHSPIVKMEGETSRYIALFRSQEFKLLNVGEDGANANQARMAMPTPLEFFVISAVTIPACAALAREDFCSVRRQMRCWMETWVSRFANAMEIRENGSG